MNRFSTFSLLFAVLFLVKCTNSIQQRKNIICLIDYSGSITDQTLNNYSSIISKDIFLNIGQYDKFAVMPIDEGAKTEPVYLSYYDLASNKFSKESDGVTHKEDSIKKRLLLFLSRKSDSINVELHRQKIIRMPFTNYTDIINALEQLPNKLERDSTQSTWQKILNEISGNTTYNTKNILIICSDMIHESKEFNFNKVPDITKKELDDILKQLKNANRIPNLQGLIVFVNGRTGRDDQQIDNINYFWENYFKEAKTSLQSYDYDSHHTIIDYLNNIK